MDPCANQHRVGDCYSMYLLSILAYTVEVCWHAPSTIPIIQAIIYYYLYYSIAGLSTQVISVRLHTRALSTRLRRHR